MHPFFKTPVNHFSYRNEIFIIGPQVLNRLKATTCLFSEALLMSRKLYNFINLECGKEVLLWGITYPYELAYSEVVNRKV